jgi:hypothetical protein
VQSKYFLLAVAVQVEEQTALRAIQVMAVAVALAD